MLEPASQAARAVPSVAGGTTTLPFELGKAPMELLWRSTVEDDEAIRFMRDLVVRVVKAVGGPTA